MTTVAIVSPEQNAKFEQAAQQFVNELLAKYPKLHGQETMDAVIAATIASMKEIGVYRHDLNAKAFWAGFNNAVYVEKTFQLPTEEPVLTAEQIEKLQAAFPPVIKFRNRELTQREKNALSGVERQSARQAHSEKGSEGTTAGFSSIRNKVNEIALRTEYKSRLMEAETAQRGTHSASFAERKRLHAILASDKRFDAVRN
jgi:hypothetical protein